MSLTRLVLRERALLESRPRGMSSALVEHLVPLQERLDDWRRAIAALDKESTRGTPRHAALQLLGSTASLRTTASLELR